MHLVGFYYKNIPVVHTHTRLVAIGVLRDFIKREDL